LSGATALLTNASIAKRIGSGRFGQASRMLIASGSICLTPWSSLVEAQSMAQMASPEVLAEQRLRALAFRLLTGLFQVRVLVGELK
jgi:hypothetical protein